MDITILQIQSGSNQELSQFKKEIISYLTNKKFSTKSITLIKTIKMIDKEMIKRRKGYVCTEESFFLEPTPYQKKLSSFSDSYEFLQSKRSLEDDIRYDSSLLLKEISIHAAETCILRLERIKSLSKKSPKEDNSVDSTYDTDKTSSSSELLSSRYDDEFFVQDKNLKLELHEELDFFN